MNGSILKHIKQYAKKHGLDPAIVYGVCQTESNFNQYAVRYEPNYRWIEDIKTYKPKTCTSDTERVFQKMSIGIMQVMGGVFRQYGYKGWLSEIFHNLDIQFDYGCRHLKNKISKYGDVRGVLAYNSGRPIKNSAGEYINQGYYNKVLESSREYPKKFCQLFKT